MFHTQPVRKLIRLALEEDVAHGDVTVAFCVPPETTAVGKIIAREKLVVCGLGIIDSIFRERRANIRIRTLRQDGEVVKDGDILAELYGDAGELLTTERTILNFLQRLSGIASLSREYAEKAGKLTVLDTRKTVPGWRILDRYAVATGGCKNHRFNLSEMILVKNNHVDALAGSTAPERMRAALAQIQAKKSPYLPVDVEIRDMEELKAALEFKPSAVLLDNMDDAQIQEAVAYIKEKAPTTYVEVSGGITLERIPALSKLGIDAVSVGALTRSASNVDISMRITYATAA